MGNYPFLHQEPPGVRGAGNAAAAITEASDDLRNCLTESTAAAAAHPGWDSTGSLDECTSAWQKHLAELFTRTARLAENLHLSANQYEDADNRSAEALREFHWEAK